MSRLQTLAWVDEVMPEVYQRGDWENPDETIEFPDPMLSVAMKNRLRRLVDEDMDGGSCEAQGCADLRPTKRPAAVGYVLHEDDDEPHRSGVHWHWTTVVEFPDGRVILVCEDCTPSNIYPAPTTRTNT